MVDADIVPRAAGLIGSHRNGARPGRVDGRSLIAGHINAVVHSLCAQDRVGTHSEGAGDGIAGYRGRPGGIGGRVSPCKASLARYSSYFACLRSFFLGGNFLHQLVLKCFRLVHQLLVFLGFLFQLPQHVVGFGALFFQLGFRRRQLLPGAFQLGFSDSRLMRVAVTMSDAMRIS